METQIGVDVHNLTQSVLNSDHLYKTTSYSYATKS